MPGEQGCIAQNMMSAWGKDNVYVGHNFNSFLGTISELLHMQVESTFRPDAAGAVGVTRGRRSSCRKGEVFLHRP